MAAAADTLIIAGNCEELASIHAGTEDDVFVLGFNPPTVPDATVALHQYVTPGAGN